MEFFLLFSFGDITCGKSGSQWWGVKQHNHGSLKGKLSRYATKEFWRARAPVGTLNVYCWKEKCCH